MSNCEILDLKPMSSGPLAQIIISILFCCSLFNNNKASTNISRPLRLIALPTNNKIILFRETLYFFLSWFVLLSDSE